jgi:hypothetical protein
MSSLLMRRIFIWQHLTVPGMSIRTKRTVRMTALGRKCHIKWPGLQSSIPTKKAATINGIRSPDELLADTGGKRSCFNRTTSEFCQNLKNHFGEEFWRSFGERIQAALADGLLLTPD